MKKSILIAMASAALLSGCYGKFALTNKVYDFNGSVHPNKIVQSVIMVGLNIIPVYGIAIMADALILNSVEFWTGTNPMNASNTFEDKDSQGIKVHAIKHPDGTMDLTFRDTYGGEASMTLIREDDMVKALDSEGKVFAQASVE